jgi:ubiquinone/menaquinone biosynthesis C-methylase UbiE
LDSDDFAKLLMAANRREWQNPDEILDQMKIAAGMCAADLGCGPGYFTIPLSKKIGKNGLVFAVDEDPAMLRHLDVNLKIVPAESELAPIKEIESSVYVTSIPEKSCDLILFANVLHDLSDRQRFFAEMDRLLKKGAMAVDIDWHKMETNGMGPPLEWRLSENDSRRIILDNGFRIVYALNAGPYHYGFAIKRKSDIE